MRYLNSCVTDPSSLRFVRYFRDTIQYAIHLNDIPYLPREFLWIKRESFKPHLFDAVILKLYPSRLITDG